MESMEPRPTAVRPPIHLRIADDIRMQIERGELPPGAALPTLAEISAKWSCGMNSARGAIALLRAQGLITSGRGKAPVVRIPPRRVIRSSERHQIEKDLALQPEAERGAIGEAETNLNMSIGAQRFSSQYDRVQAGPELAKVFDVEPTTLMLRRQWEATDPDTDLRLSWSVSHIPLDIVKGNPALLDPNNEPWPGGTQHQLSTVGVEIMKMVDEVTARMPTTVEAQLWGLSAGVPLIFCRRISIDADGRVIETSDADYPADRTELHFVTPLRPWPKKRQA
ncbi:GntR family transcriptional regulator [Dactylosporangium siamense]|nr:GntR family transcriptional regulator [Dactylosporangium siamense]